MLSNLWVWQKLLFFILNLSFLNKLIIKFAISNIKKNIFSVTCPYLTVFIIFIIFSAIKWTIFFHLLFRWSRDSNPTSEDHGSDCESSACNSKYSFDGTKGLNLCFSSLKYGNLGPSIFFGNDVTRSSSKSQNFNLKT